MYGIKKVHGVRKHQYTSEGIKLLNVANLINGKIDLSTSSRYISKDEATTKYKHFLVDEGDLIIASSGIQVNYFDKKMGFAKREHLPLCMNTSTIRFKALDSKVTNINYFMWFLKSDVFKKQLGKLITGSAQLNFGPSHLKKIKINMPSLEEQQDIVKELDKIQEAIDIREKQIEDLDKLIKSQFVEMFESKEYPKKSLADVCEELFAGGDVKKEHTSKEKTDKYKYPIYTNGEKLDGLYGYTDIVRVNKEAITISGRGTIGFTCVRNEPFYPAVRLIVAVPNKNIINTIYLKQFIENKNYGGQGASIPQLTVPMIKSELISIPPIEEQSKFAEFVKLIDKQKFEMQKNLEEIQKLQESLMITYFK